MTSLLAIVAEPRRQHILRMTWHHERSAGDIATEFKLTFGAVSQHLRILEQAGALLLRKSGRCRFYRANRKALGPLAKTLEAIWADRLGELKFLAEQEQRQMDSHHEENSRGAQCHPNHRAKTQKRKPPPATVMGRKRFRGRD